MLDASCARGGLRPGIACQASAPAAVADLAARRLGVAILSATMAARSAGRLVPVGIDGLAAPAVLALIWALGRGPALRELVAHCRQAFTAGDGAGIPVAPEAASYEGDPAPARR